MKSKKCNEIVEQFREADQSEWSKLVEEYSFDDRQTIKNIVRVYRDKINFIDKENKRLEAMRLFENQYPDLTLICGIDEVGRGPLAGPVVAAGVILPKDVLIYQLNDSKKLGPVLREKLYYEIKEKAISFGIGVSSPERIDEINVLQATYEAMTSAVEDLIVVPDLLLVDAVTIPQLPIKQVGIVKGDLRSVSIAAASIIAKETRDNMMKEYAPEYPEYGFEEHKGYGTKMHIEALKRYGPCPIHRRTFIKRFF